MSSTSCQPQTLHLGTSCDMQYCFDCKMMHLNIGAMTLRLSRSQFQELMGDLSQGAANLRHRELGLTSLGGANVTPLHS